MTLSSIVITRNEEKNISNCLKALKFADEIIVVDNNSYDGTVNIAKKLGAKVFKVPGLDFSYLRNYGKEKAKSEWMLYIDADERVTESLASEIKKVLSKKTDVSGFAISRQNYYFDTPWPKIEKIVRLVKKDSLIGWQGQLHESALVAGKIGTLMSILPHYTHRDLTSMIEKTNEWSEIESLLRFQNNHPKVSWWRFFRVMVSSFWKSYITEEGWKTGVIGIVESIYQAFSIFITYAKLWERQNAKVKNRNL